MLTHRATCGTGPSELWAAEAIPAAVTATRRDGPPPAGSGRLERHSREPLDPWTGTPHWRRPDAAAVVIGQPPGPPDGPAAGSGARARAGRPGRGRRRCGGWSRRFFGACGGGACSGKAGRHPRARERQRGRGARFIVVGWRPAPWVLGPTSQARQGPRACSRGRSSAGTRGGARLAHGDGPDLLGRASAAALLRGGPRRRHRGAAEPDQRCRADGGGRDCPDSTRPSADPDRRAAGSRFTR